MKKLLLSLVLITTIAFTHEPQERQSPLVPHITTIPMVEYSYLVGLNLGLITGAGCAFIDHFTNDALWIISWCSMPPLRKLINSSYFESFKAQNHSLKEKNKLSKRKKVAAIIGDLTAWMVYFAVRGGLK